MLREALKKTVFFRKNSEIRGGGSVFLNLMWNFGGHCFWPSPSPIFWPKIPFYTYILSRHPCLESSNLIVDIGDDE